MADGNDCDSYGRVYSDYSLSANKNEDLEDIYRRCVGTPVHARATVHCAIHVATFTIANNNSWNNLLAPDQHEVFEKLIMYLLDAKPTTQKEVPKCGVEREYLEPAQTVTASEMGITEEANSNLLMLLLKKYTFSVSI